MRSVILFAILVVCGHYAFTQSPTITSFAPASGPVGTQVVITGTNFSAAVADNHVYFGAVKATVQAASTTTLTIIVPPGASFEPVSVAVNHLIAWSQRPFMVTYPDGGVDITSTSFSAPTTFPGEPPAAVADLDGDQRIDLITGINAGKITVHRNTTTGTSISFTPIEIGSFELPTSIKVGDIDGDGLLDIVAVSQWDHVVYIAKNTSNPGNISFNTPITLNTLYEPRRVAIGDLDKDGRVDIACSVYAPNGVVVFRNTSVGGTISFAPRADFQLTGGVPGVITIGDLNEDKKPEVVVSRTFDNTITVLQNTSTTGAVSFASPAVYATDILPVETAIADLDGDGHADIFSCNAQSNTLSIFRNAGTPSLSFDPKVDLPVSQTPQYVSLSDLNADGKTDIVLSNDLGIPSSAIIFLKNTSTPGAISFASLVSFATSTPANSVMLGDFDKDGLVDMAAGNPQARTLSVFTNKLNINTQYPQCPTLLTPANNVVLNFGIPQSFTWLKDNKATGYRLRIIEQSGAYSQVNTTDTFFTFAPGPGINYTWNVTPLNMVNPALICAGFSFSTCPAVANPYTITAAGATTLCRNQDLQLNCNAPAAGLQWFLNNVPITGATATSLTTQQEGVYTVRILNGNCYSNPTNDITVTHLPTPVKPGLSQVNDTNFCEGGSVTITSSFNINNQWFNNTTAINNANGISYTATTSGDYYVRVMNTNTGCYNYSDTVRVTSIPSAATPVVTVTGNLQFCRGDSVKLQSSAATGYQWFVDGVAINGATSQELKAKTTGTYTVKTVNASNCSSAASSGIVVTTIAVPSPPIVSITGSPSFCAGDSLLMRANSAVGIQWYKNHVAIPGATNQDFYAKDAGPYTVTATQNGCTSIEGSDQIPTVLPTPAKPVITSNGTSLSTVAGMNEYQWYRDNVLITTAFNNQYATTQNGIYKVTVTGTNGCKNTSDNFNYVTTDLNDVYFEGYTIRLTPNPVVDQLTIQVKQTLVATASVRMNVIDITGKQLQSQVLKPGTNIIDLKKLKPGIYIVLLKNGNKENAVKILKGGS